ncbi:translocation/assembly module TamB domain-containing protein [Sphingomonas sp. S1-29]|uniref:translocation/assembly module TamB domain-containing protein n=1 Tax=Sphingomonas sp. S1-29 TaxID=2991074 RepID=UPI002AD42B7D|nr:translocation/assembly module TamB domain-containing protein [Sphingomonas sp. S1-29]
MTEVVSADIDPAPAVRKRRWPRVLLAMVAGLLALVAGAVLLLDTQVGHRFVADQVAALKPANGLRYRIGRIEGSIYGRATLIDVRIYDARGLVFAAPRAQLDWRPLAWSANRLDIRRLTVPRATLAKLPNLLPTGRQGPILPGFDIAIGWLAIDRLEIAPAITGQRRIGGLVGRADVRDRRALVDLAALVEGSDFLRIKLDATPDRDRFDLAARGRGRGDGVLARLAGVNRPLAFAVEGDGRWARWQGSAAAKVGGVSIADLRLGVESGRYTLGGEVAPASLLSGRLQRLTSPRVRLNGAATFANRRIEGTLSARSAALAIEASGGIDLAENRYRNLRTSVRVLQPSALVGNMTGRDIALRVILDGGFSTARFDYRLTTPQVAFDRTGFEQVRIAGQGRLSASPVTVPIRLTAARVTGVGNVAGGILRNLSVAGALKVTAANITGDQLQLRSDKLSGRVMVFVDLRTGQYEVGLAGGLQRYLIPGLGIVDVDSRLSVVPGANGRGTRILGRGTAQVVRLDNGFFRSLTGGLPRIVTGLERGADRILYFRNAVLTSPDLTLRGNGFRRVDGTFYFEGSGTQRQYGPVTLKLNGRIDRPTVELRLALPNATLGLSDVQARLDPTPQGYVYTAAGGSRLGPFTSEGAILLPRGGSGRIEVARLDVAGTRASGALDIVAGGFDGRLDVAGGGLSGNLAFAVQAGIQRIDGAIDAQGAQLAETLSVRRGQLRFTTLLDPAGTTLEGNVLARGLRAGGLTLARFDGSARLVDGVGDAKVALAGSRGRGFAIDATARIAADSYTISGGGTVDRRPLKLVSPAVIRREGDGWRLEPTRLTFADGEAQIAGTLAGGTTAIDASVTRMPLTVLDIGYPGLGLGGRATGKLSYVARADAAPTGSVDMTIRGLSRAGLVLSSRPIDVGVKGVLQPGQAGFRAIMASGGRTIGRAQARLAPLGAGSLAQRLANAPLVAQLRYGGPADTLWRLTGIELFDLSGPVAIGADVSGRLADPRIRGSLRSENARIESTVTGTVLTNVQTRGRFNGSRLVIDQFQARDGRQGSVSGSGSFDLSAVRGFGIDLNVNAQNALLINRDDIGATVTGPISITSDGRGGTIGGEVVLNSSRYRLGQAVVAAPIPRLNITEINQRGGDDAEPERIEPWKLDLRARAPGNMAVTGLGLDSEWSANLRIGGEPTAPQIRGRADLVRGDYDFAGRSFDIDRGRISFDGSVPSNPALDISANANTQGLNATIRVTGNALKPQIGFSSIPALPEDELLSRLLFGTSITNLSAPEALQLASAVSALQDGGNGLDPINAVRRAAGLDRLRIVAADPQTGQGTSIAAGKFVTRRTYVEIISDGQGYSATRVEFQLTRWLSLLSSISTIGRQSANVRVSRDY